MSLDPRSKPDCSPCEGKCSFCVGDDVCRGCGRTLEESRDWNTYTSEEKLKVKAKAKERRRQIRGKHDL